MNDFTVKCPYCGSINDFTGDDWHDELIDDSCDHDIPCQKCGKEMVVIVNAVYTLEAEKQEDDEEEAHA